MGTITMMTKFVPVAEAQPVVQNSGIPSGLQPPRLSHHHLLHHHHHHYHNHHHHHVEGGGRGLSAVVLKGDIILPEVPAWRLQKTQPYLPPSHPPLSPTCMVTAPGLLLAPPPSSSSLSPSLLFPRSPGGSFDKMSSSSSSSSVLERSASSDAGLGGGGGSSGSVGEVREGKLLRALSADAGASLLLRPLALPSSASGAGGEERRVDTPVKVKVPLYLCGHSYPSLHCRPLVTFLSAKRPQPNYVQVKGTNKRVSMYSNWRLSTHNPNPAGLTSRMLLALYRSRYTASPTYAASGVMQYSVTHSSYWQFKRSSRGGGKGKHSSSSSALSPSASSRAAPLSSSSSSSAVVADVAMAEGAPLSVVVASAEGTDRATTATDTQRGTDPTKASSTIKQQPSPQSSGATGLSKDEVLDTLTSTQRPRPGDGVAGGSGKSLKFRAGYKSEENYEYVRGRGRGKYVCQLCGIRCKKPSMLKKHVRTHTDYRPYQCLHCRFSFKTKGNLTKHMKSKAHQKRCLELGVYPVPMTVDDCQIDEDALAKQCQVAKEARISQHHSQPHPHTATTNPINDQDNSMDDDNSGSSSNVNVHAAHHLPHHHSMPSMASTDDGDVDDDDVDDDEDYDDYDDDRANASMDRAISESSEADVPGGLEPSDPQPQTSARLERSRAREGTPSYMKGTTSDSPESRGSSALTPHETDCWNPSAAAMKSEPASQPAMKSESASQSAVTEPTNQPAILQDIKAEPVDYIDCTCEPVASVDLPRNVKSEDSDSELNCWDNSSKVNLDLQTESTGADLICKTKSETVTSDLSRNIVKIEIVTALTSTDALAEAVTTNISDNIKTECIPATISSDNTATDTTDISDVTAVDMANMTNSNVTTNGAAMTDVSSDVQTEAETDTMSAVTCRPVRAEAISSMDEQHNMPAVVNKQKKGRSVSSSTDRTSLHTSAITAGSLVMLNRCHVCQRCSAAFVLMSSWKQHMATAHGENMLPVSACCKQNEGSCTKTTAQPSASDRTSFHMSAHLSEPVVMLNRCHVCQCCTAAFVLLSSWKQHMASVHGEKVQVSAEFATPEGYDVGHHGNVNCEMKLCNREIVSRKTDITDKPKRKRAHVKKGSRQHGHSGHKPFLCDVCGKAFTQAGHLKSHQLIHTGHKPFVCNVCSKAFTEACNLNKHKLIHRRRKKFACDVCSKPFTRADHLKLHKLIHNPHKLFQCHVCSKVFTQSSHFKSHQLIHTGRKPFVCSVCSKAFTESGNLNKHKLIHRRHKKFACDVCSKTFTRADHLKLHKLIHTPHKLFKCHVCSKVFTQSGSLKSHQLIHSGHKPFVCDVCDKAFNQTGHLNRHKRIHDRVREESSQVSTL